MLTIVENPTAEPQPLDLSVDTNAVHHATIAPHQTTTISVPLPPDRTNLGVHITGSRSLVLLRTSFE